MTQGKPIFVDTGISEKISGSLSSCQSMSNDLMINLNSFGSAHVDGKKKSLLCTFILVVRNNLTLDILEFMVLGIKICGLI